MKLPTSLHQSRVRDGHRQQHMPNALAVDIDSVAVDDRGSVLRAKYSEDYSVVRM